MVYLRDEHPVHVIMHHLVWTPKRSKAILVGLVGDDCRALIERKCEERGWATVQLAVQPDHIHLPIMPGGNRSPWAKP